MDGAERTRRAEELALAAAYATVLDDTRDACAARVGRILGNHRDRPCRAMCGAIAAADTVSVHDTEVVVDDCVADMDHGLLLRSDRKDGAGRTDL